MVNADPLIDPPAPASDVAAPRRRRPVGNLIVGLLALLTITALLAGCSGRIGEDGRIGVIYLNAEGYYAGVKKGMQESLEKLPNAPQIVETNAQSDPSSESAFIDTVTSAKVDALILAPTSAQASIPAVRLAKEAGIPVICYNTCLTDEATEELVDAWVLGAPREFGAISGRQMGEYFREQNITNPKVGVLNCEQFEVCIERRKGFEEALFALVPGAEIVSNQQGLTVDESVERASQMLTAHPDLDAFYGEAGSATVGSVRAIESRGLGGEVVVFGGDMSTQVAQMLRDGTILKGVADISGRKVGETIAQLTVDILDGNPPAEIIVPAPVDAYAGTADGAAWLKNHPDGIP